MSMHIGPLGQIVIYSTLAGLAGFYLGRKTLSDDVYDSDDEDDDPKGTIPPTHEECKMVLVVRTDLKMGKGKAAAQCSHAAVACYKIAQRTCPHIVRQWEVYGQMKVALQCQSEDEMELLYGIAMSLNIPARIIHDAGRTQIAAGSATVLGLGPAPKSLLDQVTGELKLF